jgi:hypothetical protein
MTSPNTASKPQPTASIDLKPTTKTGTLEGVPVFEISVVSSGF